MASPGAHGVGGDANGGHPRGRARFAQTLGRSPARGGGTGGGEGGERGGYRGDVGDSTRGGASRCGGGGAARRRRTPLLRRRFARGAFASKPRETRLPRRRRRRASRPRRVRRVTPRPVPRRRARRQTARVRIRRRRVRRRRRKYRRRRRSRRRRVRRFRARTRRRRRRGRPRAISPGLALRSLALRSLASRVSSHLALATETTACDVRVGVVRPPRIPPLVFLLRAPAPLGRSVLEPAHRARTVFAQRSRRCGHGARSKRRGDGGILEPGTRRSSASIARDVGGSRVGGGARGTGARGGACRPRARARETRGGGGGEGGGGGARGAPIRSKETARVCGAGASIRRAGLRARIHRRRVTRQRGASTVGREAPSRREPTRVLLETPLGAPSAREAAPSSGFRPRRVHSERRARVPRRAGVARVHANRARARRERRRRAIRGGAQTRGDGTLAGVRAISTGRRDDVARVDA